MAEVEGRGSVADPTECELVDVSLQKKAKIKFAYKLCNSPPAKTFLEQMHKTFMLISRALRTHEKVTNEKKHPPVTLGTGTCALCTMQQMRTSCCKGCKSKPLVLLSWPRVELSCAWSRGRRCELSCRTGHRRIVLSCVELENSQSQSR